MRRTLPLAPLAVAGLLLTACSQAPHPNHTTLVSRTAAAVAAPDDADARAAAVAILASLSDAQRENTLLALDHDAHHDWHFVPRRRPGLAIGDMTDAQRHHLHRLLQAALSDSGYLKAMDIVWLESVLQELEDGNPGRDPGRYNLLLFGDPSDATAAWGWRFEGHHLSLNFTYTPDGVVTTPLFMGTAPAVVPSGLHAGKRILADEHNLAFAFIASLTDEQREQMMLDQRPRDVITGPGREQSLREPAGIAMPDLSPEQSDKLFELVNVYFGRLGWEEQHQILLNASPDTVHFAWAGSTSPDEPHYYRIYAQEQFVIEYNCQGSVNHVHGVFHDLTDPLAEDLLRRHFEQHHAEE